jgi:hypothetical protein
MFGRRAAKHLRTKPFGRHIEKRLIQAGVRGIRQISATPRRTHPRTGFPRRTERTRTRLL